MQFLKYVNKKTVDLASICAMLAMSFLFISLFLKDDLSKYISQKHKLSALKSSAERNASLPDEQQKTGSDISALEMEMNDYKKIFRTGNRASDFLNYITEAGRRHRVEVSSVEPGEVVKGDLYTRNVYTTILSGGFYDIYNYLYRIEEDWKAVKIERVVMDKNHDDSRIQVILTVAVLSI